MHPYATDSNERIHVALVLAFSSVLAAWAFSGALTAMQLTIPWWLETPSILGFYGLLTAAFDRWLWRLSFLRTVRLVRVPDLQGTWTGAIASSFDNHASSHATTVRIRHSWARLRSLVGYWSFEDATGTRATDFSGNHKRRHYRTPAPAALTRP